MYSFTIPKREFWDEENQVFVYTDEYKISIEHSLASVAEWEAKYKKPFLNTERTLSETVDYIRMMSVTTGIPDTAYAYITPDNIRDIEEYMNDSHTATWFAKEDGTSQNREVITAEIIYYWMIAQQVPMECQHWHLQRLITLIRVCSEKNKPQKKMSRHDLIQRNRALNEARRKKLNSRG